MGTAMGNDSISDLADRAARGDGDALELLFSQHRDRLKRMVELRMDARLRARLDPSDVVQEACLEIARRLPEFQQNGRLPFYLWVRLVVGEKLTLLQRRHLGARMRDAGREISLYQQALPEASSAALAAQLLGKFTSPSNAAVRAERLLRLQEALNALDSVDREVLALRHFEQMSRKEAALALGITEEAGAKRYLRALARLKSALAEQPGGLEGLQP